jgi:hypothetical protein
MKLKNWTFAALLFTSTLVADEPTVIDNAKVILVTAEASENNFDEKVIYIPDGWNYVSHAYWTTAQFGNIFISPAWTVTDSNDPSRVSEVHIKVAAFPFQNGPSSVKTDLIVTIVPR